MNYLMCWRIPLSKDILWYVLSPLSGTRYDYHDIMFGSDNYSITRSVPVYITPRMKSSRNKKYQVHRLSFLLKREHYCGIFKLEGFTASRRSKNCKLPPHHSSPKTPLITINSIIIILLIISIKPFIIWSCTRWFKTSAAIIDTPASTKVRSRHPHNSITEFCNSIVPVLD